MVAAIGIDAGEKNKLHPANHATDIVGGEALPAIAQPGASGVRLEQVGGEIDEGIGRDPFPGMQSTRDDDGIQAGRIWRTDAQRVRMPSEVTLGSGINSVTFGWALASVSIATSISSTFR